MRTTGENFARGSCRALKWVALLGVVFALGSAPADAQITISSVDGTAAGQTAQGLTAGRNAPKVDEGARAAIKVKVVGVIENGHSSTSTVTVNLSPLAVAGYPADPDGAGGVTKGEGDDRGIPGLNYTSGTFTVPAHSTGAGDDETFTKEVTLYFDVPNDIDAEDEIVGARVQITAISGSLAGELELTTGNNLLNQSVDQAFIIEDDETQAYELRVTTDADARREGGDIQVALSAVPPHTPTGGAGDAATAGNTQSVVLYVLNADGTVAVGYEIAGGSTKTIPTVTSATVNTPANDGNRTEDTIVVRMVRENQLDAEDEVEIDLADIHALPAADKITAQAYASNASGALSSTEVDEVTEGAEHPVHVTITVDRGTSGYPSGEQIQVALRPADGSTADSLDYELEDAGTSDLTFETGSGKKTATFKLRATGNDSDIGDEMLVFDLVATGKTAANGSRGDAEDNQRIGSYSITIVDATTPQVSPTTTADAQSVVNEAMAAADVGDDLNPDESFMLDANDLFGDPAAGFDVSYGADVVDGRDYADASVSGGDMVTVTARAAGTARVRVTATATPSGSSVVSTSQTQANVAQVEFDVVVVLADLEVTVSAPENMRRLTEGGSPVTITATANRANATDINIRLLPATGSTALPDDYSIGNEGTITIAAGDLTGTTTLMAREDGDYREGTESLTLQGWMGSDPVGSALTFTIVDPQRDALTITLSLENRSLTEGQSTMVTATASRAVDEDTTVRLRGVGGSASPDDYSVEDITIGAGETTGTVALTAEADDDNREGSETLMLQGSVGDMVTNTVEVTIADPAVDAVTFTLSVSPDEMNVTEGESATLTATASRAVDEDTTILLRATGGSASPNDYSVGDITIEAGETTGTTMLRVALDDDDQEGSENLMLQGTVGDMVTNILTVNLREPLAPLAIDLRTDETRLFEGESATLTARASRAVEADTVVHLSAAPGSEVAPANYDIGNGGTITIAAGAMTGTTTLTATRRTRRFEEEGEILRLQGSFGNLQTNPLEITILPQPPAMVRLSRSGDGNITEGQSATVTATADRPVDANMTVRLLVVQGSASPDDYSIEDITIEAGATTGTAVVMAVADDDAERMETLTLRGLVGNMETNTLTFNIWDAAVPALPVIAQLLLAAFLAIGGYRRYLRR